MSTPSSSNQDCSALTLDGSALHRQRWASDRPGTEPNSFNGPKKQEGNGSNIPNLGISGPHFWGVDTCTAELEGLQVSVWLQTTWNYLKLPETHCLCLGPTPQRFAMICLPQTTNTRKQAGIFDHVGLALLNVDPDMNWKDTGPNVDQFCFGSCNSKISLL